MKTKINISLSDAVEGMELAEDAIDAKGVRLITAGTLLSASAIKGLEKRNIKIISVNKYEELTDEQRNETLTIIKAQLDHCFNKVIDQKIMQELKTVFLEHKSRDLQ